MQNVSKWFVFSLVAIAQFMVVLDVAITNVALPTIARELGFSTSALQWVVGAYALAFGGFLLLGGRVADLFGRRRTLLAGMIGFTFFSLLIGLSGSPTFLIALRALQGLSAAFMSPAALSIVLVTFRDGPSRNRALGYWSLVATGGAAAGLLLGGFLTQFFGWRWNFFVNVPVGLIMSFLIARYVPAHAKEETKRGLDISGALLVTASLMLLALGFSVAPQWGWTSLPTLGTFLGAVLLLAGFLWNESRVRAPLIPLSIFRIRNVSGANLMMVPLYAAMLGMFFLITLYLQGALHLSPLMTGLSFLPFPVILGFVSTRMPKLVGRYGFRRFLIMGPALVALAYLWLVRLPEHGTYLFDILPALLIMPIGMGMSIMPTIAAGTSGVPSHEAGLASGLISTAQQMGGALGLSVLTGIAASTVGPAVLGYHAAFSVGIGFLLAAVAVAVFVIHTPKKEAEEEHLPGRVDASKLALGH